MPENQIVSIIMNCYNGEKYLREALDSILAQIYKNWELIFWDNQSTDKSVEIFKSYADERLNLPKLRRSYYANKFIKKGEILDKSKIKFVRPALGKSINKLKIILNKTAKRNILNGELLTSKIIK